MKQNYTPFYIGHSPLLVALRVACDQKYTRIDTASTQMNPCTGRDAEQIARRDLYNASGSKNLPGADPGTKRSRILSKVRIRRRGHRIQSRYRKSGGAFFTPFWGRYDGSQFYQCRFDRSKLCECRFQWRQVGLKCNSRWRFGLTGADLSEAPLIHVSLRHAGGISGGLGSNQRLEAFVLALGSRQ